MDESEAIAEIRSIAKRCDYKGKLTDNALKECAKVYAEACNADGVPSPRRYMRAQNGHATNLDEFQWIITRTPHFKEWFGKSVVVDANGDPKVMYHGSWQYFNSFKPSTIKMEKTVMTLWSGPGFYFSDKPETAKIYAGGDEGRVYEAFIRLENPLVVDETGNAEGRGITKSQAKALFLSGDNTQWLNCGLAAELARMDNDERANRGGKRFYKGMTREEKVEEYIKRLKTDVVTLKTAAQAFGAKSQRRFLEAVCRATGHDGVIHTVAPGVVEYVVYSPSAIKSALENNGSFSKSKEAVEDSALTNKSNKQEGDNDMIGIKAVIDSLKGLVGGGMDKAEAMDIVDHNGRHHQPKAIPEGGEFESEGKYAATSKAKEEWFHKTFAENNKPQMKKMRETCSKILSHIDSSKFGNDTAVSDYKKQIHKYGQMTKKAIIAGMKSSWDSMKRHADTYNEIKDMGKADFAKWVSTHPEYQSPQMQKLLTSSRYNKRYKIQRGSEYVDQDHEAWEEAKMMVGRMAVANLVDYMAHTEALRSTPDALIDKFLEGKGEAKKHTGGFHSYEGKFGIEHGEGETAENVTMSEINAVESELSKAIEDAQTDKAKTAYFHALSHILGKDGGLRDPEATKESVVKKAEKRLAAKKEALEQAKLGKGEVSADDAQKDYEATQEAISILKKAIGYEVGGGEKDGGSSIGGDVPKGTVKVEEKNKEIENKNPENKEPENKETTGNKDKAPEEGDNGNGKAKLNDAGVKFKNDISDFLKKDSSQKYIAHIDKWLGGDEKSAHQKVLDGNGIAANKKLHQELLADAQKLQKEGNKGEARKAIAKYFMTVQHLHSQLEAVGA